MAEPTSTSPRPAVPGPGADERVPTESAALAVSRRGFFASGGAGIAAAAGLTGCASADLRSGGAPASGGPGQRLLLRGGVVLTMDPKLGDFEKADVLIE